MEAVDQRWIEATREADRRWPLDGSIPVTWEVLAAREEYLEQFKGIPKAPLSEPTEETDEGPTAKERTVAVVESRSLRKPKKLPRRDRNLYPSRKRRAKGKSKNLDYSRSSVRATHVSAKHEVRPYIRHRRSVT